MAGGLPHPVLLSTFCNMDQITIGGQVVEFKHVFYSWVCMAVLFVVAYLVRRRRGARGGIAGTVRRRLSSDVRCSGAAHGGF